VHETTYQTSKTGVAYVSNGVSEEQKNEMDGRPPTFAANNFDRIFAEKGRRVENDIIDAKMNHESSEEESLASY
jgi:hypothetical protein